MLIFFQELMIYTIAQCHSALIRHVYTLLCTILIESLYILWHHSKTDHDRETRFLHAIFSTTKTLHLHITNLIYVATELNMILSNKLH